MEGCGPAASGAGVVASPAVPVVVAWPVAPAAIVVASEAAAIDACRVTEPTNRKPWPCSVRIRR